MISPLYPRKSLAVAFLILLGLIAQYYVFILLFPDGGLSPIRTVLDAGLAALMFPIGLLESLFEPLLPRGRFPGYISVPLIGIYLYLLSAMIATGYERVFRL